MRTAYAHTHTNTNTYTHTPSPYTLHRKVKACASATGGGAVRRALCAALHAEIADFYRLMAILEVHAAQPIPVPGVECKITIYADLVCTQIQYLFKCVSVCCTAC